MVKKGIGCSLGKATGTAHIIGINDNVDIIPNNSIIVVEKSSPQWILSLMNADGIICEVGGRMSHLAILCRELGKPCVTGIDGICSVIHNGDIVSIDGYTGEVIIYE